MLLHAGTDESIGYGVWLAIGMMLSEWFRSVFANHYWFAVVTLSAKYRSLMYSK